MRVLMVGAECAPYAKVGGLADVLGSLPKYLRKLGVDVATAVPLYSSISPTEFNLVRDKDIVVNVPRREIDFGLWRGKDKYGVEHAFFSQPGYFGRGRVYGEPDDAERFFAFSQAVVEFARQEGFDVVHANDWHTGVVPLLIKDKNLNIKTVFTVHNLAYQGQCGADMNDFLGVSPENLELVKELGNDGVELINPMKAGLLFADYITTVSPTYAKEILTPDFGMGLDSVLRQCQDRLVGILNGLDTEVFDPSTDPHIYVNFSDEWDKKKANTQALKQELGLEEGDSPVLGMVGRFVEQKGIDIVVDALNELVHMGTQVAALGTGDKKYETLFQEAALRYPGRVALKVGFDPVLANRIYAGSTHFLMPSRFEPCGLGQMIALRYGSVPVVRKTGGLADTVFDADETDVGNGFVFEEPTAEGLVSAVKRSLEWYRLEERWMVLFKRAVSSDVSWNKSASLYVDLYRKALEV
ncbi:glycogen synthase [Coprothermobacteraceae bacterium]|nr:glycogen synthase [Coprothermobacteraceae bacterium]